MTHQQRPLKDDVLREVRRHAILIGLVVGVTVAAVIIGFLTDWTY